MTMLAAEAPIAGPLSSLIARYDGRAPRYTSYPTAVQFTPEVDETTYRAWLRDLGADEAVSLYLHVPFCARLCWYCGCNTRVVRRREAIASYVRLLIGEIGLLAGALPHRLTMSALHLGGGTPNMLSIDDLDDLSAALGEAFDAGPDLEVAAELDPGVLTGEWVRAAAAHGLTRASLGVQNLAAEVQQAVNRQESFAQIVRCVGWLREAGISSINFDLMYGLPRQTTLNTLSTLELVLPLRPERIALFGYAHVPWMKTHQLQIDETALPGAAERLEQYESAAELLLVEGYERIGLDHFALPDDALAVARSEGRLSRNFQGYTADPANIHLGLGASAIGALPQGFVQNTAAEPAWREAVAAGRLPIARGVALTDDDRFRGEIIERLMCDFRVDLAVLGARHGRAPGNLAAEMGKLEPFVRDGLVRIDGARLQVTARGRDFVRSIAAVFDVYFQDQGGRHSRAV